ncbi:MAG TPA: NAD-binding protein [Noviherbaspirillum sp.]|nr:NAD-binding protein [Noviherbaspirillum sp.]
MNSIIFLVLRRMRAPLILLIVFYAIAVLGLTLVPGVNADGTSAPPLSFFHAFYFISYTATTIGFGEIPNAFSDAQRLWVTVCIYLTVIAWTYSILTLLALIQDKSFQHTLVSARFARRVAQTRTPFYLICGCGETGGLICRALDHIGHDFVIVEKDELRVQELDLEDFKTDIPTLTADARLPANLLMAGLRHPKCRGVLAMTSDEECNLAVAISSRLLNPDVPVLARARSPLVAANMASFGTDHIINAFDRFAEYLALAVASPECFRLIEILTGLPGTPLPETHRPPRGRWIVCGYGRFGRAIIRHLGPTGIEMTVVDPEAEGPENGRIVRGLGTEASTLIEAGIEEASGIVAGSDDDFNNLSIAMTAKEVNPKTFVVVRQNLAANGVLFETFHADFSMVPTRIVAQESIAILATPLLARFLAAVRQADESWSKQLAGRLESLCEGLMPEIWDIRIDSSTAPAVYRALVEKQALSVGQLIQDNANRDVSFRAAVLMIERDGKSFLLPENDFMLKAGDFLLIAGEHNVRSALDLTLRNANALQYVLTGREKSNGWLWQRLFPEKIEPVDHRRSL